jgi:hypothetical protein
VKRAVVLAMVVAGVLGLAGTAAADTKSRCERGQFCWWPGQGYRGGGHALELATVNAGECVPLAGQARSFANRMRRPVTVYQSQDCDTVGEFDTYPGGGTFVPVAPYMVRAVQVWER